jgi:hypothetical protein
MITNYLSEKQLALYGILNNFDGYTIDKSAGTVTVNVEMAYNISDVQLQIDQLESEITDMEENQDINSEYKALTIDDKREIIDILKVLLEKLS